MDIISQEFKEHLIKSYSTSLFLIGYMETQGNYETAKRAELIRSIFFEKGKIELLHELFKTLNILIEKSDDEDGINGGRIAYMDTRKKEVMVQVNSALNILTKENKE